MRKPVTGAKKPGASARPTALVLAVILGVSLSGALFFVIRGWERKSAQDELDNLAQERVEILQNRMLGSLEVLHSVAAFYSANEHFSRVDFDKFVADARVRHPELQGLSWDPLVADSQRAQYEDAARQDGFGDFKFRELNAEGRTVPATHRDQYVPVYYEQPFEKNEAAMGFDLASNPQRKAALDQARDTGLPAATVPIRLVQETENQMGFLVVMPIYRGAAASPEQRRQNLAGFGSAVFRVGDLVESAWKNLMRNDVNVTIVDRANGNMVIYLNGNLPVLSSNMVSRQTLAVAGMTWDVLFRPAAGYSEAGSLRQSWAALGAGLMITALMAAYISRGLRRTAEIEQRVAERTAELSSEVAERQRVEDALRQTEKKYRDIFENSIEGIFQTTLDGRYISANPALARIYGYASPGELMVDLDDIGGKLYVDPKRREEFMRIVQELGSVSDFESQVRRKDGRVIWIAEKARAVRGDRDAIIYYEGAVEDVTERKLVAETLQKAYDELEVRVAERTAELAKSNEALQDEIVERKRAEDAAEMASRAKSTFLAHMSHEIRTPLNAILGYAQILQRNQNLTPDQRRAVETIAASGNHLFGLIDDVLDISKIEAGRMELQGANFDLHSLVRRLDSMFQHRCQQKGIRLRIESSVAQACWVHGDEGKLRQVLINLLGNAVKFTEAGEVTLRIDAQAGGIHRFEVRDTGIGIPAEEQANVLQPFHQGSRGTPQGGAGLGLAITRQCVDLMGGKLWFTSEEGKGSSFCFTASLPPAGAAADHEQNFLQLAPGQRVLALVVDDIRENREVLASILKAVGCEVVTAENGAQAIELARESRPDIVFMDIWMPGMNGIETTQRILSGHGDKIKMVAHSASAFDHEQKRYLDAGFDDFFAKPFRSERLCECLKNLLHVELEPVPAAGGAEAEPPEPCDFALPEEMAARVRAAAELYSTTEIRACLAEIARTDPEGKRVAEHLQRMADRYDMNAILEFLDKSRAASPVSQS